MKLPVFDNVTGEAVVEFERSRTSGPEYEADNNCWYHQVRVRGERVFEYGCPCGTCGILFRKLRSVADRLSDTEGVELLGSLDAVPGDDVLRRLARVLAPGRYRPIVAEAPVRLVEPGTDDDYFANEVVQVFGLAVR
jgi:hypothetical protein